MLMTEASARNRWCPMTRVKDRQSAGSTSAVFNRDSSATHPLTTCVGSRCAMWRWAEPYSRQTIPADNPNAETESAAGPRRAPQGWEFCPAEDDNACWVEPEALAHHRRGGYCGLAGKPEITA